MTRVILILLLGISSVATAQDEFKASSTTTIKLPPDLYGATAATPAPDLDKYLSPDGRFIDECRYWHDHPDPTTLMYGWPVAFPRGQIGQSEGVNGQPAPYVRCAINPCPPNGYICWRNPAKPTTLNAQVQAVLKAQGCEAEPNGDIYCRKDRLPHPGPPSPTFSSGLVKSVCHVIASGISCDPKPTPGNEGFSGGSPAPPPQAPKYAPLDWSRIPMCTDTGSSPNGGLYINYFKDLIHSDNAVAWVSDSRYVTVGGHGGAGDKGLGACPWSTDLVPPRQIATDVHTALMTPGNANKKVRLAVCDSADANPKDPNSAPLAQQLADAYRELYGTPITVEGYNGNVPYGLKTRLQGLPCRAFTSRTPLPAN